MMMIAFDFQVTNVTKTEVGRPEVSEEKWSDRDVVGRTPDARTNSMYVYCADVQFWIFIVSSIHTFFFFVF